MDNVQLQNSISLPYLEIVRNCKCQRSIQLTKCKEREREGLYEVLL